MQAVDLSAGSVFSSGQRCSTCCGRAGLRDHLKDDGDIAMIMSLVSIIARNSGIRIHHCMIN